MFRRIGLVALLAIAITWATPARASVLIDFSTGLGGPGGTIIQSGANLTGTGILIDNMLVNGAPQNNGNINVDGTAASLGLGGNSGVLNFNTATGTFSIIGSIPSLGVSLQTLLSGIIQSFSFTINGGLFFQGFGTDSKSPDLLAALGISPTTPFAFRGFTIGGIDNGNGSFTATSTDINNRAVPEPATMTLLGTGLLAIAGVARRRYKTRKA